jgi:hypothetical protein
LCKRACGFVAKKRRREGGSRRRRAVWEILEVAVGERALDVGAKL